MTGNPFIRLAGRSGLRSLMVIMSLLAATVVVAPAASAASDCYPNNDGSEELIVLIDDDDGDEVVLEMRDNVLYVDGEACGTPGAPATGDIRHSIFIGDLSAETKRNELFVHVALLNRLPAPLFIQAARIMFQFLGPRIAKTPSREGGDQDGSQHGHHKPNGKTHQATISQTTEISPIPRHGQGEQQDK